MTRCTAVGENGETPITQIPQPNFTNLVCKSSLDLYFSFPRISPCFRAAAVRRRRSLNFRSKNGKSGRFESNFLEGGPILWGTIINDEYCRITSVYKV